MHGWIAIATALMAAPSAAQKLDCANATSQADMTACAGQDRTRADAALNKTYNQVLVRLSTSGKQRLRASQRAWVAWRDAECAWRSNGPDGGSAAPMTKLNCASDLSAARTKQLAAFRTCEEGDLSCPR